MVTAQKTSAQMVKKAKKSKSASKAAKEKNSTNEVFNENPNLKTALQQIEKQRPTRCADCDEGKATHRYYTEYDDVWLCLACRMIRADVDPPTSVQSTGPYVPPYLVYKL